MLFKTHFASLLLCAASVLLAQPLCAQLSAPQPTDLASIPALKDAGLRTYHFTVEYNDANSVGQIVRRQRVTGDYTRGFPNNEVAWNNVAIADADGPAAPFAAPQKRDFMEGFRYRDDLPGTMAPDFFKSFPAAAVLERNLVWDTGMFEWFGQQYLDKLRLNEPFHTGANQDVKMPGIGTFQNRDVVLEWLGRGRHNGQDCALIEYRAFLNPVDIAMSGMTMHARSDYWGQIWVSLANRQIEYATIYEEVTGEITLPGRTAAQPVSVFRIGRFEPVAAQ
ncbi:MAG TPA: hypothetical protein VHZ09_04195 [Acidobacteriaceae bacterium]|jgi:hypothetical protein|nr:hypothetical protein [Acidobacteriaceae bacterium]